MSLLSRIRSKIASLLDSDRGQATEEKAMLESARAMQDHDRYSEAAGIYRAILERDPSNITAQHQLGCCYAFMGNDRTALPYLRAALSLRPDDVDILSDLGESLARTHAVDEAMVLYRRALAINPLHRRATLGLAAAFFMSGDDAKAEEIFEEILRREPYVPSVYLQVAQFYHFRNVPDIPRAAMLYEYALQKDPDCVPALTYLSDIRLHDGQLDEALALTTRALVKMPDNVYVAWNHATILLANGDYKDGWRFYERGLESPDLRDSPVLPGVPFWRGESLVGKKLLIIREQGLGDALQFIRYAALCKERGASVYVLCAEPLSRLFQQCPFIDGVLTKVHDESFDVQVVMLSLPYIFGTTLETIPSSVPYLFVPRQPVNEMATRLKLSDKKLRIGLVWSGGPSLSARRGEVVAARRNVGLKTLLPLFECQDIQFVNLQMGEAAKEIDQLGLRDRFIDPMTDVKDMQDTAAIIQNLDLVVSVDTSVVHLTGGLGKPVWVLSRYDACWRWLRNRPDSPWYPTAKVFGQPSPGDWGFVVDQVMRELDKMLCDQSKG